MCRRSDHECPLLAESGRSDTEIRWRGLNKENEVEQMTNGMEGMGWGMGLIGLLVLILLVLGIAALLKYLISGNK